MIYLAIVSKTATNIHNQTWLPKIFSLLLATLAPLSTYVHFLIFLLLTDAATSIYYQYKGRLITLKKKEANLSIRVKLFTFFHTIESSKLRITVEKLVSYILAFIVAFLFDKYVLQITPLEGAMLSNFSLANVTVILVCSVEVTSIFANLSKITGHPVYTQILKILNKKIDDKINQT
jgi:hypothetical protein